MEEQFEELESKIDDLETKFEEVNEKLEVLEEINGKLELLEDIHCAVDDIPKDDIYDATEESALELLTQLNTKTLLTVLTKDRKNIVPVYFFSAENVKKSSEGCIYIYSKFYNRESMATYEDRQVASANLEAIFKAIEEGKKFYDADEDVFYDAHDNCVFTSASHSPTITVLSKNKYQIVQVSSLRAYRQKRGEEEYCIGCGNTLLGLYPNKEEALCEMKNIFKAFITGQNFYQIK